MQDHGDAPDPPSATDTTTWLQALGLERHAEAFVAQQVTPDLLAELTDADLRELGVALLGERKRILRAARALEARSAPAPAAAAAPSAPAPAAEGAVADVGERRHATVVFSDLTGYTALNEAFDPEEVEAVMARVKHEAIAVFERHGGRVNQFVGDEVMALFGIPVAHRDDARRAVAAALELHRAVDGIAADYARRLGRTLAMHSGVQTGLVIARRSDTRAGDFTLTGDTVNTAARLRSLARPGEVVVSAQTWQLVSDHFDAVAGPAAEVRGKERPLVPWRILRERESPRTALRPLVGRQAELAQFTALAQGCRERGRVVVLRGDPGLGKSRLAAAFLERGRELGFDCHAATVLDFGARTGHDAILALALSLLGLPAEADAPSRAEALSAFTRKLPGGAALRPFLHELLDTEAPAEVVAQLSEMPAHEQEQHTLEALAALARPDDAGTPQLLLVEDVHWADAWTLRQLAALGALAQRQPLLLLLTTRPAGDPTQADAWRVALHGVPMSRIDLGPLAPGDALALATGGGRALPEGLLQSCIARAEGNPLFLEQLVLSAGADGCGPGLPGSVQALIQARMDRLPPADKAALQAAAVWGQRVPRAALRVLTGDPHYDPQPLVDHFLLRPDGDTLVFHHALIRDGAYASLLLARRRQLHVLAAEWVEARDVALAAEHFERAEDPRAVRAYLLATRALAQQFQHAAAQTLLARAERLATTPAQRFATRLARGRLLLEMGRAPEAAAACTEALPLAQDAAEQAQARIALAAALRILDRVDEGLEQLALAEPLAAQAGLTLDLARLHSLRGNLMFSQGRTQECQQAHERALELARAAGSAEAEASALGGIGDALYARGAVRSALSIFERCIALARSQGFPRVEVAYLTMVGWCKVYLLDFPASLQASEQTLALARRIGNRRAEIVARAQLAMVDGRVLGHWEAGLAHAEAGLAVARALGSPRFEANLVFFIGLMLARGGQRVQAREKVLEALALARQGGMPFLGGQIYGTLARLEDDPTERRRYLALGEAELGGSAVSHNFLVFYECAIDASLEGGDWAAAERYCQCLQDYCAHEPIPWADFMVARGRALVRSGRGERSADLKATLAQLQQRAMSARLELYLPEIEAALAGAPMPGAEREGVVDLAG